MSRLAHVSDGGNTRWLRYIDVSSVLSKCTQDPGVLVRLVKPGSSRFHNFHCYSCRTVIVTSTTFLLSSKSRYSSHEGKEGHLTVNGKYKVMTAEGIGVRRDLTLLKEDQN